MNKMSRRLLQSILWLVLGSYSLGLSADITLYRYKNKQGLPVINSTIPAEYAQSGYEIITASGEVIQTITPAPSKGEIKKADEKRATLETYALLKRRYSNIDDIERAKQRKLNNIDNNVAILNGNMKGLQQKIDELVGNAAEQERKGRAVPAHIFEHLADTRAELAISEDMLKYRKQEYREVTKKYDNDIRAYIKGEMLIKESEKNGQNTQENPTLQ